MDLTAMMNMAKEQLSKNPGLLDQVVDQGAAAFGVTAEQAKQAKDFAHKQLGHTTGTAEGTAAPAEAAPEAAAEAAAPAAEMAPATSTEAPVAEAVDAAAAAVTEEAAPPAEA